MSLSPVARGDLRDAFRAAIDHSQSEPDAEKWVPALRAEFDKSYGRALAANLTYRVFALVNFLRAQGLEQISERLYDAAASADLDSTKKPFEFDGSEIARLVKRGTQ